MSETEGRCPSCSASVGPGETRCRACGHVLGENNRCDRCHALAPAVERGGRLVCSACGSERERLPNTVVVSDSELDLSPDRGSGLRRVYNGVAVALALIGLSVATILGLFGQNSFEVGIGLLIGVLSVASAGALWWVALRSRERTVARRAFMIEQKLLGLAAQSKGILTAAQVSRQLGISAPEADATLEGLVRKGKADMDVTERGEIRFVFDQSLGTKQSVDTGAAQLPEVTARAAQPRRESESS